MNLYLNGVQDFSIACADTLEHPAFVDGSQLRKFDVVLANPPYSIREWNRNAFANDKWRRNSFGIPPQGRADYAFMQHIIASMNDNNGRCAILLPHGVLFRNEESGIREQMVRSKKVEAVIGLGPNLFYNAPMEACIIICNNNKPEGMLDKVIFINAKNEVTRKNAESFLEQSHIEKILKAYHSHDDIDDFKRIVDLKEIEKNHFDLTIHKYVFINEITDHKSLNLDDSLSKWLNASKAMCKEYNSLKDLIGNAI